MASAPDPYGSGIGWTPIPSGRRGERCSVATIVRPRLFGPDNGAPSHVRDAIEALFSNWPRTLEAIWHGMGPQKSPFSIAIFAKSAAAGDAPLKVVPAQFKMTPSWIGQAAFWDRAFIKPLDKKGPGLRNLRPGGIEFLRRPSALASGLYFADLVKEPERLLREIVPPAVQIFHPVLLQEQISQSRADNLIELFGTAKSAFGAMRRGLAAVAREDWLLPLGKLSNPGAINDPRSLAALRDLKRAADIADQPLAHAIDSHHTNRLIATAVKDLVKAINHARNAKPGDSDYLVVDNSSVGKVRAANRHDTVVRALARIDLQDLAPNVAVEPYLTFAALLAPVLHSPSATAHTGADPRRMNPDLAALQRNARLQMDQFFSRTQCVGKDYEERFLARSHVKADGDFFARLAQMESYRGALRPLGLILDLDFEWPADAPSEGAIAIVPDAALYPDCALGFRTNYVALDGQFRTQTREERTGITSLLDRGRVRVGDTSRFQLTTESYDAAIVKASLQSDTAAALEYVEFSVSVGRLDQWPDPGDATIGATKLPGWRTAGGVAGWLGVRPDRLHKLVQDVLNAPCAKNKAFPAGSAIVRLEAPGTSSASALPVYVRPLLGQGRELVGLSFMPGANSLETARRMAEIPTAETRGFSLIWSGKGEYLAKRQARAIEHEANLAADGMTSFDQEDLLAGIAVEARLLRSDQPKPLPWQELSRCVEIYDGLTFREQRIGPGRDVITPVGFSVFRTFDVAPGQGVSPNVAFATPTLFTYTGGLLSVTDDSFELRGAQQVDKTSKPTSWVAISEKDPLPALLFADAADPSAGTHEFRAVGIDLAGRHFDDDYLHQDGGGGPAEPSLSVKGVFARREPLAPPRILLPRDVAETIIHARTPDVASVPPPPAHRLAMRAVRAPQAPPIHHTADLRSPTVLVVGEARSRDFRWLVPSRVSPSFCRRYGKLDKTRKIKDAGSFNAGRIDPETGDFPTLSPNQLNDASDQDAQLNEALPIFEPVENPAFVNEPYYPDPLARSIAVSVRDESDCGLPLDHGSTLLIPLYRAGAQWPHASAIQLVLEAAEGDTIEVLWHDGNRVLTISLPPGQTAQCRLSTSPAISHDQPMEGGQMEVSTAVGGAITHAQWSALTVAGVNPEVSPGLLVTLIHPCRTPLFKPTILGAAVYRDREELSSKAQVNFDLMVDARSTSEVSLVASWEELIDNVEEPAPRTASQSVSTDPIAVGDPTIPEIYADTALISFIRAERPGWAELISRPQRQRTWPFQHPKHYAVKLSAVAKTRYSAHFQAPPFPDAETHSSLTIMVPNATPPPAPIISHIVPTFGWSREHLRRGETSKIDPKVSGPAHVSRRHGGSFRIYFDRPHMVSGPGERIGVFLADGLKPGEVPDPCIEPLVTRWGADPLHGDLIRDFSPDAERFVSGQRLYGLKSPNYTLPTGPLDEHQGAVRGDLFTTQWFADVDVRLVPRELVKEPSAQKARFILITSLAEYDSESGRWYFDLVTDIGSDNYFPFIRLALVRLQENSLDGCHLSTVVRLDYAQPVPDRAITVRHHPTTRNAMRITICGPDRRGDGKVVWSEPPPANLFEILLLRARDGRQIGADEARVIPIAMDRQITASTGAHMIAAYDVYFTSAIDERKLVILEHERHGDGQRVIFADVMGLEHHLL